MDNIAETLRPVGESTPPPPSPKQTQLTPLPGILERWSTVRHHLGFYNNVAITARYTSTHNLTQETLYTALTALISTYAPLGITLLNEDTPTPRYARLKKINLNEVVTFITLPAGQEIDTQLQEQHNLKFHNLGQLPLWRILVLGSDIAFIYHHALGDGGTGKAFHGALLKALNSPIDAPTPTPTPHVVTPPAIPLLPPLEELTELPLSYMFLLGKLWTRIWFPREPAVTFWSGGVVRVPLRSLYRSVFFSAGTLDGVVAACRRERTTVTALLQVLAVRAVFGELPESETSVASAVPVDLRRFVEGVEGETMGVFVASVGVTHMRAEVEEGEVWEVARRWRGVLERRVRAGTGDTDTGLLKHLSDYEGYFRSMLGRRREGSVEVSNLGVFSGEGEGEWRVERMVFSQSAAVTGCAIELSVVSVKGGEMGVGVSVQEGVVEEELLERVVERLRGEIEAAGWTQ